MSNKILCITDSLGLPRPGVIYEDTWFSMVKRASPQYDFISYFVRASTSKLLRGSNEKDWMYGESLLFYKPQIVIIQLGICDCAPRYMRENTIYYKMIIRLPAFIQNPFWKLYKATHDRTIKKAHVSITAFRKNLEQYIEMAQKEGVEKLIYIKIATSSEIATSRSPQLDYAVKLYNEQLDQLNQMYPNILTTIDPLHSPCNTHYVDGYHPNEKGNKLVAKELLKVI